MSTGRAGFTVPVPRPPARQGNRTSASLSRWWLLATWYWLSGCTAPARASCELLRQLWHEIRALLAPYLLRDTQFLDPLFSVLVVTRQPLTRARLAQPPSRDLVVEPLKAHNRNENRVTSARWVLDYEITTAPSTAPLENGFARFKLETARPPLQPPVVTPLQHHFIHHLYPRSRKLHVFYYG